MKNLIIFTLILLSSLTTLAEGQVKSKGIKVKSGHHFNVMVVNKEAMKFGVSTRKPKNCDFYINSNFFTKGNDPIGSVVINGKKISNKVKGGGYFYVKNGKPFVKAKSCPGKVEHSSQSILWAIDNGVKNKRLFKTASGNDEVYRTIIGENSKGDIMIISSTRIGLVSIKEIVDFAEEQGMVEGILLDGGSSVDYKMNDGKNEITLKSVPSGFKSLLDISEPTTYIYGNFN
jgi:hypothetical protein